MKFFDYILQFPKLFDWYFNLLAIKRIQLNYIVILSLIITLAYINDKQHRQNYTILSAGMDNVNNSRAKEQKEYNANLKFYTDKFNHLLELLIQQRKEKEIKNNTK